MGGHKGAAAEAEERRSLIPRHEHAACLNSHKLTAAFRVRGKCVVRWRVKRAEETK